MNIQTQQHHDFIKMVANRLAEKFIRPLFEFTHEKNYSAHIGGLAEIQLFGDRAKDFQTKIFQLGDVMIIYGKGET